MKLKDLAFIGAVVLLLAPFFLSNDLYAAYLACNASHPYLMACRAGQWISRRNLQCRHFAIGNPSVTGCHILYGNSRSAKSAANPSIRRRQTKIYRHTPFFYASVKSFSQRVRLMNRRVVKTDRICKKRN